MRSSCEIVRFLIAIQDLWFEHFPRLTKRGEAHIATYLSVTRRDGCAVGELAGYVKQLFLLDESTIKERLRDAERAGLLALDPPLGPLSSRTAIVPTPALLDRFDAYLGAVGAALLETARRLDPAFPTMPDAPLPVAELRLRPLLVEAAQLAVTDLQATFDAILEAGALSRARQHEAKRHLLSVSHWRIMLAAIDQAVMKERGGAADESEAPGSDRSSVTGAAEKGLLADHLAAALLALVGQNFQTTRDHINYLMQLRLLERRRGKALRIGLPPSAVAPICRGFECSAAPLLDHARLLLDRLPSSWLAAGPPTLDRTVDIELRALAGRVAHILVVKTADRRTLQVSLSDRPIVFGRRAPSDVLLSGEDVSRQHCRVELSGQQVRVTDLGSTNGTFVNGARIHGATALSDGAELRIGQHLVSYYRQIDQEAASRDRNGSDLNRSDHSHRDPGRDPAAQRIRGL
jgi:FHA domain